MADLCQMSHGRLIRALPQPLQHIFRSNLYPVMGPERQEDALGGSNRRELSLNCPERPEVSLSGPERREVSLGEVIFSSLPFVHLPLSPNRSSLCWACLLPRQPEESLLSLQLISPPLLCTQEEDLNPLPLPSPPIPCPLCYTVHYCSAACRENVSKTPSLLVLFFDILPCVLFTYLTLFPGHPAPPGVPLLCSPAGFLSFLADLLL